MVAAGLLAAGGVRSLVYWSRRPFESGDAGDHVLYALYLTGRVGLWFALAGLFAIFAASDARGRAVVDELGTFRWYVLVPIALGGLQVAAGFFLGRRSSD